MKEFFEDLWDLQMASNRFLKKHWKGYLVFFVVVEAIFIGVFYVWNYWDEICKFFNQRKEDEEWKSELS